MMDQESMTTSGIAMHGTDARSTRAEVRNPILALPGAKKLKGLPLEARLALRAILLELRDECRIRAEQCGRNQKDPWRCTGRPSAFTQTISRGCLVDGHSATPAICSKGAHAHAQGAGDDSRSGFRHECDA